MPRATATAWVLFGSLAGALLILGAVSDSIEPLMLDRGSVFDGEWWRLFSAHFVHFSITHALLNFAALLLLMLWAYRTGTSSHLMAFLVASPLFLSAALLALGVEWYAGLSGVLHGLVILLLLQSPKLIRNIGLIVVVVKLTIQYQIPISDSTIPVLHEAHWVGAALGGIFYLTITMWQSSK